MFFQSFYAQYTFAGISSVLTSLYVNKNALVTTYIG
jgi:thiamine transporter ThiT